MTRALLRGTVLVLAFILVLGVVAAVTGLLTLSPELIGFAAGLVVFAVILWASSLY